MVMISTLVRWVGHIARVGCQKCRKILKAVDQLGDLGKDGRIILMQIFIGWIWDKGRWKIAVNTAVKLRGQ